MNESDSNAPKPGTPEYDEAMIAKYRGQRAAHDALNIGDGQRMGVRAVVEHGAQDVASGNAGRMGLSIRTDGAVDPHFGKSRVEPAQLHEVEARMRALEEAGERTIGYDDQGQPIYALSGDALARSQRQYAQLQRERDYIAGQIADQNARAAAEREAAATHNAAVAARAEDIIFEQEAQAAATRMKAQRKAQS